MLNFIMGMLPFINMAREESRYQETKVREDTAFSRMVADKKRAGLHPLSNVQGSPVSTPNQPMSAVDQYVQNELTKAMISKTKAEKEAIDLQAGKIPLDKLEVRERILSLSRNRELTEREIVNKVTDTLYKELQVKLSKKELSKFSRNEIREWVETITAGIRDVGIGVAGFRGKD